jgi:aspartyl-tRNA(Asn)/glutamyl-tRNA(Gln) amidotransferase subunit C
MKLSRQEVLNIATLCRVELGEAEVQRFQEQLSNILENFEVLKQVDTTDVPPTAYPITLKNVVREDVARPSFPKEDILANAPRQEDGHFRVKAVLEGSAG